MIDICLIPAAICGCDGMPVQGFGDMDWGIMAMFWPDITIAAAVPVRRFACTVRILTAAIKQSEIMR